MQCVQFYLTFRYLLQLLTFGRAEASIGLPPRALRIPPYHCCGPAFRHHPLRRTDKILCRCFGAPATLLRRAGFSPDHLITLHRG